MDGRYFFIRNKIKEIKDISIRKKIYIVILWWLCFVVDEIVLKLNLIQFCLINFDVIVILHSFVKD